jgi:hypothetical protein
MKRFTWILAAAMSSGGSIALPPTARASDVDGPMVNVTNVDAHGADRYSVRFQGGQTAVVHVVGDGDTTLELKVCDAGGNQIGADIDNSGKGYCEVQFVPYSTANFIILVINHGDIYNHYTLKTS